MMSLKEYSDPNSACLADYIPWTLLVAPGVVEHKDGALQKTFRFRGQDLDSSTARDLMATAAQFNNAARRIEDGWTLFVEAQRNLSSEYPLSDWSNRAAELLDNERREEFTRPERYFKNDYYLTLVFKQPEKLSSGARWFIKKGRENSPNSDALETFLKTVHEVKGLLSGLFTVFCELDDDETLTYLHSTVSTKRHRICTPDVPMYLDHILTDQSIEHGLELKLGDDFVRTISIKKLSEKSNSVFQPLFVSFDA